jgi:hypothetical protein
MSRLAEFFKGKETELGVFYPTHCMIAVFPNLEASERLVAKLLNGAFAKDDVIAASGAEVIELAKDDTSLLSVLMKPLSRFFATEQIYTDHDLEHAGRQAGFLVVHCPKDERKNEAWKLIEPETPLDARYYARGGIEHLAGDFDTN